METKELTFFNQDEHKAIDKENTILTEMSKEFLDSGLVFTVSSKTDKQGYEIEDEQGYVIYEAVTGNIKGCIFSAPESGDFVIVRNEKFKNACVKLNKILEKHCDKMTGEFREDVEEKATDFLFKYSNIFTFPDIEADRVFFKIKR